MKRWILQQGFLPVVNQKNERLHGTAFRVRAYFLFLPKREQSYYVQRRGGAYEENHGKGASPSLIWEV
ncbi:hypothetical protein HUG15_11070 [Salicibibacter cibarius]|uniref:Uncharacterized protein n=1 Tax=Salicibibacter cibarius TaxID=2743000 RepID=A0A7T6Z3E0_9BACI|nr:hypothetical protein [Salicibibacter cibarius]QQK76043.1 hypothetical protein HUG15_11070 [Salicibibacter cibarius]